MKISRNQVERVIALYKNVSKPLVEKESKKDHITLSQEGQIYKEIQKAIQDSPDLRQQRVSEIKKSLSDGKYNISGCDIAEKMVQRFLVDKLLSKD